MNNNPNNIPKFKYDFDSRTSILYKSYYGLISIEDITDSWEYAFANNIIPEEKKGFIVDYREASFNFNVNLHVDISNFYQNHLEIFKNHKIAVITENPNDIVIPILVRENDLGYESRPFSTISAAVNWILS